jgi:hypothetical protein
MCTTKSSRACAEQVFTARPVIRGTERLEEKSRFHPLTEFRPVISEKNEVRSSNS